MELLLSHIGYLLGEHREVAVVGLGTFVRSEQAPVFEDNYLTAPVSRIHFVQDVERHAAGLVEQSVARALRLPVSEAAAIVDEEVSALTKTLYSGIPVEIEGVGVLSISGEDIIFTPAATAGWSALGWYTSVDATPLLQEEPASVVSVPQREDFLRSLRRTASSAAAIAVLILITFITSQLPGRRGSGEPTYATFGVETTAIAPSDVFVPHPGATRPTVMLVINTPSDGVLEADADKESTIKPEDPYVLVVASLANERELGRYLDTHEADNLAVLVTGGRHRVYAATGSSVKALREQAERCGLYNRFPNAWICRR